MKLSTRGNMACNAMYYLPPMRARGRSCCKKHLHDGRRAQAIFEQLLGNLRRVGLAPCAGRRGYQIAAAPENVTLRDIIDAVEGPIELSECASTDNACLRSGTCPVRWVWQRN